MPMDDGRSTLTLAAPQTPQTVPPARPSSPRWKRPARGIPATFSAPRQHRPAYQVVRQSQATPLDEQAARRVEAAERLGDQPILF